MIAIKSLSSSKSKQFKELNDSITSLTSQVSDLVSENASFRLEIGDLRSRVDRLESRPDHTTDFTLKIFRESAERSKVESNVIAYGVPESAANTANLRVIDDTNALSDMSMSIAVPKNFKPTRLDNNNAKKLIPLKIICISKDETSYLITNFTSQARN